MNFNSGGKLLGNMKTLPYEQPSLRKYGDMKSITFASSGSSIQSNSKDPDQTPRGDFPNRGDDNKVGDDNNTDIIFLNNNPNDL